MPALRRDFLPEDLAHLLRDSGFEGCIAVQAQTNVEETEWLLSLSDRHDFIRGVVGWVDLTAPDIVTELRRLANNPRLVGVRHVLQSEPDGYMDRPDFRRGVAGLEKFGIAYDILIYERQLAEAARLVAAFPLQRFIIDHIAKPNIRDRSFDGWPAGMRRIAKHSNVWCKLSGMVTEADWQGWTPDDLMPYIEAVVRMFGADRCMIGSDWPVCTLAADYRRVVSVVQRYASGLGAADKDAILGGSAVRAYRLSPTP
jgi:L-fuconolactonase